MANKSPKHYARMIRDHVKAQPDHYADNPTHVQQALGLTDEEFELGLTFCIAKKIIVLEKPQAAKVVAAAWDDKTPDKKSSVWDDDLEREKKITTNEMAAVFSA